MYDLLVIGAGIAGLATALKAASEGAKVVLLTKGPRPDGSTNYAQGGIASVMHKNDGFAFHINDTLEAGDGLCKADRVRTLARSGPATIRQLVEWGVRFTRDAQDEGSSGYHLALEGGHSHRRILHANDLTGKEIMRALLAQMRSCQSIVFLDNRFVMDLLIEEGALERRCTGALVANRDDGSVDRIRARATVLATGGAGEVWLHSTNPPVSTGDGIAIAYRAGASVQDLEFMQFHPTALYAPQAKRTFLISEAMRGFGGILRNQNGKEFMEGVHPLRSLAPRDIVARAIHREMLATKQPHVYLDVTHRSAKDIRTHFPNIYARCLELGIDITQEWIPVVPAAHYMCGGVLVDSWSRTAVPGFYAVGEVAATGVHGANRLASNSLLESVVFALRAWSSIKRRELVLPKRTAASCKDTPSPLFAGKIGSFSASTPVAWIAKRTALRTLMWQKCGIVRTTEGLQQGLQEVEMLENQILQTLQNKPKATKSSKPTPLLVVELLNQATTAKLVMQSALRRKESRGLHYLMDIPERKESYRKHFSLRYKPLSLH